MVNMRGEKDPERIDALKERLYSREAPPRKRSAHELTDEPVPVRDSWEKPPSGKSDRVVTDPVNKQPPEPASETSSAFGNNEPTVMARKKKSSYRVKIMLAAVFFFVVAVGLSSLFILLGGNTISGENIAISVSGPFTIGGGETIPIQVGITNQNNVPIEAATLIIDYPPGTLSANEERKELFIERLPLDSIGSGETVNIPLRAQVFGEENQEQTIKASIEYRVRGSNATFFKEAEPLRFKISSSPIVIDVEAVENISSGQETEIKLKVRSNSSADLSDLLVKAEYPNGFDFTSSSPSPIAGQNAWMIDELEPEEESVITIRGAVIGQDTDIRTMKFSIGVPNVNDPSALASVFAVASTDFTIEQPFMNVDLEVNGQSGDVISINPGSRSSVNIGIRNTLSSAIYDVEVNVKLSGNALNGADVSVPNGYYNSNQQTITWEQSSRPQLGQVDPGDEENFSFSITPSSGVSATPQVAVEVTINARRVSDGQSAEALVGVAKTNIKVASEPSLVSATTHNSGSFSDIGPIPPEVGRTTSYTIVLRATNGTNDITEGVMTTTLPAYVNWLDNTAGRGSFNFNGTTRELTWNIGSMQASESVTGSFQVSILPSSSQIGTTPTLVNQQHFRANDRFTGSTIRISSSAITTTISEEFGYNKGNGSVKASE